MTTTSLQEELETFVQNPNVEQALREAIKTNCEGIQSAKSLKDFEEIGSKVQEDAVSRLPEEDRMKGKALAERLMTNEKETVSLEDIAEKGSGLRKEMVKEIAACPKR
jgi:hypothetical protein